MSKFRNVVVHDYLGINLEEVWGIVEKDLAILRSQIQGMIDETAD